MPSPQQIAAFRLEVILPFLDPTIPCDERAKAMRELTEVGVLWPSDSGSPSDSTKKIPVSRSTIRRWMKDYRSGGLKALEPKLRSDFGTIRRIDAAPWIHRAIQLLFEQPNRTLTQLELYLRLEFADYCLGRATLNRHLRLHPAFGGIESLKRRRPKKPRGSFETVRPHECWQLDGKGPFSVTLIDGQTIRVHVLTVIDDYSRVVLAAIAWPEENTEAAIRVFRMAVERFGLADGFQFDRGSAFDSEAFRAGLATCGVHRNRVKPRNPEAQGKIEAYHMSLARWFVNELSAQQVVNIEHLQQLLEATIGLLYNRHFHREIKTTPEQRLGGKMSERKLPPQDVQRAFFVEITKTTNRKTGAVRLQSGAFRVPLTFAGRRCRFYLDPVSPPRAFIILKNRELVELEVFAKQRIPSSVADTAPKRGVGQLQKLLDLWQGKERPIAQPGFGLPEVYDAIGRIVGRVLPSSDREAIQILDFYKRHGPMAKEPFLAACEKTGRALGQKRPISAYLTDLERQIRFSRDRESLKKESDA